MRIELDDNKKDLNSIIDKSANEIDNKSTDENMKVEALGTYQDDALEYSLMSKKEKREYKKKQFIEKTKGMSFFGKLKYIFTLYRMELIVTIFVIAVLCIGGNMIYRASLPKLLYIAIINQNFDTEEINEYIETSMREYLGIGDKNVLTLYKNKSVSANEDPEATGLTMTDYQTIGHYNISNLLDVIICDEEALKTYTWSDDTTAIDLSMDEQMYAMVKEHVVMLKDESGVKNDGKEYAGALDITNTEFIKNSPIDYSPVYLLIPSSKWQNNDRTLNFIKMVYGL